MENSKPSFSNANPNYLFVESNGDIALKQQSFSSTSSHESDLVDIKGMPLLNTTYPSVSLLPESDCDGCSKPKCKPVPSGGEVLMRCLVSPSPSKKRGSIKHRLSSALSESADERGDVPDSVPTREGIIESKHPVTPKKEVVDDKPTSQPQDSVPTEDSSSDRPIPTCCDVFRTMLRCKYIFTRYTILDFTLSIGSISLYFFDLITDWVNALNYLYRKDEIGPDYLFYFWLTVIVLAVPSLIITAFSIWWEVADYQYIKKEKKNCNMDHNPGCFYFFWATIFHTLQIAPIFRYIRTIFYGIKSRCEDAAGNEDRWQLFDRKYKADLADVNFIRLMESFLEAAPQIVLQIFIMIRTYTLPNITVLSVCVSLIGMSVSFVAYQRALRNTLQNKKQLSIIASAILLIYRTLTIVSRVFALALLLNINVWAWIGFFLGHWFVMSFAIAWNKTNFCGPVATTKEYIYDFVIGFCYTFAYINVHFDRYNRYRMLAYYIITFLENTAIVISWFYLRTGGGRSIIDTLRGITGSVPQPEEDLVENAFPSETALAVIVAVEALFLLGIIFFLVYYLVLHPKASGSKMCLSGEDSDSETSIPKAVVTPLTRPPCGDNYRTNRGRSQFRSWHSASLNHTPDLRASKSRPSSEIFSRSSQFGSNAKEKNFSSVTELSSSVYSCCPTRNGVAGYHTLGAGDSSAPKSQTLTRASVTSYAKAMNNLPFGNETVPLNDAELKRRRVTELLEQKQREKRNLEQKQALLRRNMDLKLAYMQQKKRKEPANNYELQDLFNRKSRAVHMYSPRSPSAHHNVYATVASVPVSLQSGSKTVHHAISQLPIKTTNLSTSTETWPSGFDHQGTNNNSNRARFSPSGGSTFPRCLRANHVMRQSGRNILPRQGSLQPICEDQLATVGSRSRRSTTSCMDLATTGKCLKLKSVPRAMSFTLSKNEVVESIESSV